MWTFIAGMLATLAVQAALLGLAAIWYRWICRRDDDPTECLGNVRGYR